jgi:hypothetical protein
LRLFFSPLFWFGETGLSAPLPVLSSAFSTMSAELLFLRVVSLSPLPFDFSP